jgi:hypothetical protein
MIKMHDCYHLVMLLRAFRARALPENLFEHTADLADGHVLTVIVGFTGDCHG